MIKLTLEQQLIHSGPGYATTKATGDTKALTKGSCFWNQKYLLTLREKLGSSGFVSLPSEFIY